MSPRLQRCLAAAYIQHHAARSDEQESIRLKSVTRYHDAICYLGLIRKRKSFKPCIMAHDTSISCTTAASLFVSNSAPQVMSHFLLSRGEQLTLHFQLHHQLEIGVSASAAPVSGGRVRAVHEHVHMPQLKPQPCLRDTHHSVRKHAFKTCIRHLPSNLGTAAAACGAH